MTSSPDQPALLTHFDASGSAHMVDVADKRDTHRIAVAAGTIRMRAETLALIASGTAKKGDVIGIARIAAIMAAKRTHELIPLAHPLLTSSIDVEIESDTRIPGLRLRATVKGSGQTGFEMEALTAVSVAALTIYDMAKASGDRDLEITGIRLMEKRGGKSGLWKR